MSKKKNENKKAGVFDTAKKVYAFFLPNAWKKSKGYFVLRVLKLICDALNPFVNIIVLPLVVDELLGERRVETLIWYVVILGLGNILLGFGSSICNNFLNRYAEKFNVHYRELASKKIMELDFQVTEDKKALDQIELARNGMDWYSGGLDGITAPLFAIVQSVITLLGISFIIILSAPWVLLLIFACLIGATVLNKKINIIEQEEYKSMSKINRIFGYLGWQVVDFRYGKDIRLYNAQKMLLENYSGKCGEMVATWDHMASKMLGPRLLIDVCDVVRDLGSYLIIGIMAVLGKISIGVTTQLFTASAELYGTMRNLVENVQTVIKRTNYAYEYVKFMDYPDAIHKGSRPVSHGPHEFEFKDVVFAYPGSDVKVLNGVNLKIKAGEHLSVVGLNGAGKTTFVKLLCRLYDPTSGEILMDGINIKEYDYESYMKEFAPVFQDFKLFAFSLKENIMLNDATPVPFDEAQEEKTDTFGLTDRQLEKLERKKAAERAKKAAQKARFERKFPVPKGKYSPEEEKKILEEVFEKVGLTEKVEKLEKGTDTYIFKHFNKNGIEPSGGEQQKIAIGRALYKNSPVVILDEPTAALDPVAEYEIYRRFEELVGGKSAIYISHRLSSCQFCDKIAVFSGGVISEYGTHAELVNRENGLYAEMFEAQAQYYRTT